MEFGELVPVLQAQGRYYVPSRVLAAMVGEPVAWDGAEGAVVIGAGGEARSFRVGTDEARLREGTSYLELDAFRRAFPAFSWRAVEGGVALTVQEGAD
jgi:carboxyl-terminal processing protease